METFDYTAFDEFNGTRTEFVKLMNKREKSDEALLLRSKSSGAGLPCSIRRIDNLQKIGVFPTSIEQRVAKGPGRPETHFTSEHCYRYEFQIRYRKMGLKLEDIARRLSDLSPDAIKERVLNWNEPKAIQELGSEDHLHSQFSELRRLGRAEGKALLSEQLNFAVTPYFHAHFRKREFEQLSEHDVDVLVSALSYRIKQELGFK